MPKVLSNIVEAVGQTPIVRINRLAPKHVNLYVKLESFNPMASIKDRLALGVIEDAEQRGLLKPGQTVIEATSGNTGIGLAMVCAQKGYPLVIVMAENFSIERRKMMRFFGARVVLTPAAEKGTGMLNKAVELAETHGWFLCRQFENEANAGIHSRTTAPEILEAFADEDLDYWVTGFGTGGTLKGVARVLKKERPQTQVVVCEPDNSQMIASGLPQSRHADGSIAASHPNFRPHLMQGWSPDFIPRLAEDAVEAQLIDRTMPVSGADAMHLSRALAREEGIFCGISGGATLAGALKLCQECSEGSTILCMLPDTGERYLSTPLFEEVAAEMTKQEWELSRSTPGCRFDQPSTAPVQKSETPVVEPNEAARAFFRQAIAEKDTPTVMFALQWCEFCWSVRKMLAAFKIPYRSVDLDAVDYQKDNWGGKVRAALSEHTDCKTIPQIFVGGEFVGGCTELFDAFKSGRLQELLKKNQVSFDPALKTDPYSFLPAWLQPR